MNKILIATHDSFSPVYGGGALRTLKIAFEFKKRGWDAILFGASDKKVIDGIPVVFLPPPTKKRSQILSAIKFNVRLLLKSYSYIKEADLILAHNAIALGAFVVANIIYKKTIVLDITDIHSEYLRLGKNNLIEKVLAPLLIKIEYYLINSADKIIVVTNNMKERLIQKGIRKEKICIVYDGVDVKKYSGEKETDSINNVIHLGLVDKQHGVEYLVKAAGLILKKFPKIKFYIIGDGRKLPAVKLLARKLSIEDNFIFTGFVDHFEVNRYFKKATIGVIPRPYGVSNNLVITLKLLEYWASGTAVVASKLKGIEEIAKDNVNVSFFHPGDYCQLAEKIMILLQDQEKREFLAKNGVKEAKKFEWSELIKRLVDSVLM